MGNRGVRYFAKASTSNKPNFRTEQTSDDTFDFYLYDEIGDYGITARDFMTVLMSLDATEINFHLHSPGGDAFDGIAIYNAIKQHPSKTTCYIEGLAASAASYIALAADKVVIARNAELMIHDAWGAGVGPASDMRSLADALDKLSDNIADIYTQKAGKDQAYWRNQMLAESWYTGSEAVDAGLADEVQGTNGSADNSFDMSIFKNYTNFKNKRASATATEIEVAPNIELDLDSFQNILKELF